MHVPHVNMEKISCQHAAPFPDVIGTAVINTHGTKHTHGTAEL
jgi:hypothetical protein